MRHLKSSFFHSLTIKIGKVIVVCVKKLSIFSLELKGNPNVQGILNWILEILHYSSQEGTKMFPNHKVLGEEKKDWIVTQERNHRYWKKFHEKSDKKQKIFSCTPVTKFQKISTLSIPNEAKQIYPKKQNKASKKRYSTSFRSSHP